GLRRLVESAGAIARNVEELTDWAGLPEPGDAPHVPSSVMFAATTEASDPEQRAEGVRAAISAADEAGVIPYRSFATHVERIGVGISRGIRSSQERTWAQFITVSMSPDGGTGYAEAAAVDVTK